MPSHKGCPVTGIDVDKLKQSRQSDTRDTLVLQKPASARDASSTKTPKLVLMGIKELGNEEYYKRRGFKSVWAGKVPVGMWDCLEECTMVYMEKELLGVNTA